MIKDYLKERQITVYALSKKSNVAYSTLNDIVNGKVEIGNCKAGIIKSIADALGMSMDDIYALCSSDRMRFGNSYGYEVSVNIRNKSYYAEFEYDGRPVEIELCRITEDSTFYITDIARWRSEEYIRERHMEEFE